MSDELFMQVNRPGDEPTELAKKHSATLCVCDQPKAGQPFPLAFRVGSIPHPMENAHAIQFVEFFADDLYMARVDFIPVVGRAEGTLWFRLPAGSWTLRAVSRCNIHGLWESAKTIEVTA